MSYEAIVQDNEVNPSVIDAEVYELTQRGIAAANAIADQEPFNHALAAISLGNLPALFDQPVRSVEAMLTTIDQASLDQLTMLASASFAFLGVNAENQARNNIEALAPRSKAEAQAILLTTSFSALQTAAGLGSEAMDGYRPHKDAMLRELVRQSGYTFAQTYLALNSLGHPITTDPSQRSDFADNVRFATPPAL